MNYQVMVAPFTGAWIETASNATQITRLATSLPSRERGLKQQDARKNAGCPMSLPSRERGLKQGDSKS